MGKIIKLGTEIYTKTDALANIRGSRTQVDYCKITVVRLGGIVEQCNGNGRRGLASFRIGIRELKGMKGEIESRTCSSSRRSEAPRNTKMVGEFSGQQVAKRE